MGVLGVAAILCCLGDNWFRAMGLASLFKSHNDDYGTKICRQRSYKQIYSEPLLVLFEKSSARAVIPDERSEDPESRVGVVRNLSKQVVMVTI